MDIVERLEQQRPVSMREAAEEIKKLRGELQTVHAHLQHYRNLRTADQSEIARLRELLQMSYPDQMDEIARLQAENERLRKEIAKGNARESVLYEKCEEWRMEAKRLQANAALADENEALRAQLDHVTITYKAEMQEAAEEIRKLRAALTEISMMRAEDMYRGDDDNAAAFIARAALAPPPQR